MYMQLAGFAATTMVQRSLLLVHAGQKSQVTSARVMMMRWPCNGAGVLQQAAADLVQHLILQQASIELQHLPVTGSKRLHSHGRCCGQVRHGMHVNDGARHQAERRCQS